MVKSKLLSASGFMLATKLVGAASGYVLAWWVSQHEGAAAYGRFELALTVLTMAALGSRLGLDGVLVKWMAATNVQRLEGIQRRLFFRASALVLACSLPLAWLLSGTLGHGLTSWFGDDGLSAAWPLVAMGIPLMAVWGLSSEALRGLSQMKSHALLQPGILVAGAVLGMVAFNAPVLEAYGASLAAWCLMALVLAMRALASTNHQVIDEGQWGWRAMVSTGWPMLLGSAMFLVMSWTDTLLLGHFLGEDQVGIYRVAFRMAAVVTLVQAAVNSYAAPLFAERHALGDATGLRAALTQTTAMNVAFSIPAFVALVVAPSWWLGWFGEAFEAGRWCLVWLAAGQAVNALCGPVMNLLNMTGHEREAQRIVWGAAILNVAMNVWAIPRHGIVGAAVATACSMAVWNVAAAFAVRKHLGLSVLAVMQTFVRGPRP